MSAGLHAMVASAVVKVARDKLVAALGDPAVTDTMRGNNAVPEQLEKTKDEMESILAVLMDAERRSRTEEQVQLWLQRVEHAAYHIWDMVDEIRTNKDAAAPMARMLPLSVSISRPDKLSSIRQAVHKIRKEQSHFNFRQHFDVQNQTCDYDTTVTTPHLTETIVVGRDEQADKILDCLLSPAGMSGRREWSVFLPIFGLAGVGKTTLATLVYSHPRSEDYYNVRAWVHVSRSFDLRGIGRSILKSIPDGMYYCGKEDSINVLDDLASMKRGIHEILGDDRKMLLVLDDIWEQDQQELDALKSLLGVGNQAGSCKVVVDVIVTTRDEDTARRICTNTVQPYKLHPLSDDLCWEFFKRASLFEDRIDKQGLDKIGREIIATKCEGLPLVAKELIRYMLRDKRDQQWLEIARTYDLSINEPMMNCLSLSYQSMPPNLRLCFAYLGTLPNRHNMAEDDIIHRWIALGLIEPTTNGISTGQQIISRLLDISFLEHSNLASTSRKRDGNKGMISFTMHNLIHCFARSLMGSTLVVADGEYTRDPGTRCCRGAVLTNFDLASSKLSSILPAELRALSLLGCSKMELRKDSFSSAKYLQVLELREPSMQKLPDSICQLRLLGYLNLSGCSGLVQLPESSGKLLSVLHINLSGCSGLVKLPESFGNLTNVIHVNLSGCVGLKSLPKSFGLLKKLEHLDLSSCSCLEGIQSALGGLTNLQHLNLSHPCGYISQHRFHLKGLKDVWDKLIHLRYLNLSMCLNPILCYLPLPVEERNEEERNEYVGSISGLRSLEHLDLSHNIYLFDIPRSLGQLSQLQTLNLSGCVRLKRIDKWMGEQNFPKKSLVVSNCLGLDTYQFVVRADRGAKSSNLSQLKDVSCKELEISCLEKVVSGEAESIRLAEKKKLQKLILVWSAACDGVSITDPEALLAELVPPQNLQYFELHGYRGQHLPTWLTSSIFSHLPNLVEVTMVDIPSCSNLPPFGVLPNLQRLILRKVAKVTRIDAGCLSGGSKASFHRLLHVTLDGMGNLEEFSNCSSSDELVINACPKLRFGDPPPKARMLVISDCDQLLSSPAKRRRENAVKGPSSSTCVTSSPMTEVVIESCKVPLDKLKWNLLQRLAPVDSLHIRNCSEKIMSPEIMKEHLSSLKLLCFSHCDSMTYLPEHVVQGTSLEELVIHECPVIKSLPQSICEEKKEHYPLLRMRIQQCPELKKWCELKENKEMLGKRITFEGESSSSEAETSAKRTSSD